MLSPVVLCRGRVGPSPLPSRCQRISKLYLFLLFLLIPLVEIALFIQVGGLIGLWPTLAIVVATAIAGASMVRTQGVGAMNRLQSSLSNMTDPTVPLADGAMIFLAGALLLTPGFFTDGVGLALLLPPVRLAIFRYLQSRIQVREFHVGPGLGAASDPSADVIEGEFEEVAPEKPKPEGTSGWVTEHQRH